MLPKSWLDKSKNWIKWLFIQPRNNVCFHLRGVLDSEKYHPKVIVQLFGQRFYQELSLQEILVCPTLKQMISTRAFNFLTAYQQQLQAASFQLIGYYRTEQGEIVVQLKELLTKAVVIKKLKDMVNAPELERLSAKDILRLGEMLSEQRVFLHKALQTGICHTIH